MNEPRTRNSNFDVLRLLLASMVIISHSFEIIDGNRSREPLTRLFGTLSLGEVAVGFFFVLSGFLIVQSWQSQPQWGSFLKKRVLRIVPGFVVAFLFSVLVAGYLGATDRTHYFSQMDSELQYLRLLFLLPPSVEKVTFVGTHYPGVNNSMWTIFYEFRCYLLAALIGLTVPHRGRLIWPVLLGFATLFSFSAKPLSVHWIAMAAFGDTTAFFALFAYFCAGATFFVWREKIKYSRKLLGLAAVVLLVCLFLPLLARPAMTFIGSYILLGLTQKPWPLPIFVRDMPDISYGVYLYGWPMQKVLLWLGVVQDPLPLCGASLVLSACCGWLSWHYVEKPCLRWKPARNVIQSTSIAV